MIRFCCYYCKGFREDTCEKPQCYNAFAHPKDIKEGKWYCSPNEGGECPETITNDGKMTDAHKECWKVINK